MIWVAKSVDEGMRARERAQTPQQQHVDQGSARILIEAISKICNAAPARCGLPSFFF